MDAFVAIGSMILLWILGALFAHSNLKMLIKTKPERLAERRAYKKIKNERLRKFYGLDKK